MKLYGWVVALLAAATFSANAFTYYVNDSSTVGDLYTAAAGVDAPGNGTNAASPMASLTNLLATYDVDPGDTVFIDTGVYAGYSVTIGAGDQGSPGSPVVFQGSTNRAAGGTIFSRDNASAHVITISAADDLELRDITVKNGNTGIQISSASDCLFYRVVSVSNAFGYRGANASQHDFVQCQALFNTVGMGGFNINNNWSQGVSWNNTTAFDPFTQNAISISNSIIVGGTAFATPGPGRGDYNVLWNTSLGSFSDLHAIQLARSSWHRSIVADPGFFDPPNDFHSMSVQGRFSPAVTNFITNDLTTSILVDFADRKLAVGSEPVPNGGRANAGVHGGTSEASKSPTNEWLLAITFNDGGALAGTGTLYWSYGDAFTNGSTVRLDYSPDEGMTWSNIVTAQPVTNGSYVWNASGKPSSQLTFWRVVSESNPSVLDSNDTKFVLRNAPFMFYVNDTNTSDDVYSLAPGSPTNNGLSADQPMVGIQSLIDVYDLDAGDMVFIDTGLYPTGTVKLTASDKGNASAPVTLQGSTSQVARTIIDRKNASLDVILLSGADYVCLKDLTVQGGRNGVLASAANDCIFDGVISRSNTVGFAGSSANGHVFERCLALFNGTGFSGFNADNHWRNGLSWQNTTAFSPFLANAVTISNSIIVGGSAFIGTGPSLGDYNVFWNTTLGSFVNMSELQKTKNNWYNSTYVDPQFVNPPYDFHLLSDAGRFEPGTGFVATDAVTSVLVDLGSPAAPFVNEPTPNGSRVNIGPYGNTSFASKSPTNERLLALTFNDGGQLTPPSEFVNWAYQGANTAATVRIEFSGDQGSNWNVAVTGLLATSGVYVWSNTNFPSSRFAKWRVVLESNSNVSDAVNSDFVFRNGPFVYYVNDGSQVGDVYCSAPGTNSNLGVTSNSPKGTLDGLLSAFDLDPGDIVYIDTGLYEPLGFTTFTSLDSGTNGNPVLIQGSTNYAFGGSTFDRTKNGSTYFFDFNGASNIRMSDVRIRKGDSGIRINNSSRIVLDGVVSTLHLFDGIIVKDSDNVTIRRSVVSKSSNGLRVENSAPVDFEHSVSWGNSFYAIRVASGVLRVTNSVVSADGETSSAYLVATTTNIIADYNDLYASDDALIAIIESTGRYVDTLSSWVGLTGQDRNSLSVNPLFADPDNDDFHLKTRTFQGRFALAGDAKTDVDTSLLIDSGSPFTAFGEEPGANGGRVNIGRYGNSRQASVGRSNAWLLAANPSRGGWVKGTGSLHWVAQNMTNGALVDVEYSHDGGLSWSMLTNDVPAANELFVWDTTVTNDTPAGLWRVTSASDTNLCSVISNFFAIRNGDLAIYINDGSTTGDMFVAGAGAATNFVATTNRPFNSLRDAVEKFDLEPGDTIYVDVGRYENPEMNIRFGRHDSGMSGACIRVLGSATPLNGSYFDRLDIGSESYGLELYRAAWLSFSNMVFDGASVGVSIKSSDEIDMAVRSTENASHGFHIADSTAIRLNRSISDENGLDGVHVQNSTAVNVNHSVIWSNGANALFGSSAMMTVSNSVLLAYGADNYVFEMLTAGQEMQSEFNNILTFDGARVGATSNGISKFLHAWQLDAGNDLLSLSHDPLFAGAWTGDFHLMSAAGRFDAGAGVVTDAVSSLLIDAGDPSASFGAELAPNGGRLNMGLYGDTDRASRSTTNAILVALTLNDGGFIRGQGTLRWLALGPAVGAMVYIDFSSDGGLTWTNIATNVNASMGSIPWDTTNYTSGTLSKWRIVDEANTNVFDETDSLFAVNNDPLQFYVNDTFTNGDVYATAPGSELNSGLLPSSPLTSVNEILRRYELREGDTIFMDTGEYDQTPILIDSFTAKGTATNRITLQGSTNAAVGGTRINARNGEGIVFEESGSYAIRNMTITNASTGIRFNNTTNCLVDNVFVDARVLSFSLSFADDTRFVHSGAAGRAFDGLSIASSVGIQWDHGALICSGKVFRIQNGSELSVSNSVLETRGGEANVYDLGVLSKVSADYNHVRVFGGAILASSIIVGEPAPQVYENLARWSAETGNDVHSLSGDAMLANHPSLDFHPLSQSGRYDRVTQAFVVDSDTSILIDAGDPNRDASMEQEQNGDRINIGVYGGTAEASMTPSAPSYSTLSLNDGGLASGTNVVLRWVARGAATGDTARIQFSPDGGATWQTIQSGISAADGMYTWDTTSFTSTPRALWRILRQSDASIRDESDSIFALRNHPFEFYVNDANPTGDVYTTSIGSITNHGLSPDQPMASLQSILKTYDLEGGDTVFIDTGVYVNEELIDIRQVDSGANGIPVTLQGSENLTNGGTRFEQTSIVLNDTRGIHARHLHIVAATNAGSGVGLSVRSAVDSTFEWIRVDGASAGITISDSRDTRFENCTSVGAQSNGLTVAKSLRTHWEHGILWSNGTAVSLSDGSLSFSNSVIGVLDQGALAYNGTLDALSADYNDIYVISGAEVAVQTDVADPAFPNHYTSLSKLAVVTSNDTHSLSHAPGFFDARNADFHPVSLAGRFHEAGYALDTNTSLLIDAGDPERVFTNEVPPEGRRINIGLYGATDEASKSPTNAVLTVISFNDGGIAKGTNAILRWIPYGDATGHTVNLEFSPDAGTSWQPVVAGLSAAIAEYTWDTTSFTSTPRALWRLTSTNDPSVSDRSDRLFSVRNTNFSFYANDGSLDGDVYTIAVGAPTNHGLSIDRPMVSLQAILDSYDLESGDSVFVDTGLYSNNAPLVIGQLDSADGTNIPHVVFMGSTNLAAGGTRIVRGQGANGIELISVRGVTMSNFIVQASGAGVRLEKSNLVNLHGVHVRKSSIGYQIASGEFITLSRCVAQECSAGGLTVNIARNVEWVSGILWSNAGKAIELSSGAELDFRHSVIGAFGEGARAYDLQGGTLSADYNCIVLADGAFAGTQFQPLQPLFDDTFETVSRWSRDTLNDIHTITQDPLFADPAKGDFHLRSVGGRYSLTGETFVVDGVSSPLIDAGDPLVSFGNEPGPNGSRINIGLYGDTSEASMSATNASLTIVSLNDGGRAEGSAWPLRWVAHGDATGHAVRIEFSPDAGSNWELVTPSTPAQGGEYIWNTAIYTSTILGAWRIVSLDDTNILDQTDGLFAIRNQSLHFFVNNNSTVGDVYTLNPGSLFNDGASPSTPKLSIQAVLDAWDLEPGDSIFVDRGEYIIPESITISPFDRGSQASGATNHITIQGVTNDLEGTIIRSAFGGAAFLLVDTPGIALKHMTIRNANTAVQATRAPQSSCEWMMCKQGQIGIAVEDSAPFSIRHCVIRDNALRGISFQGTRASMSVDRSVIWSNKIGLYQNRGALNVENSVFKQFGKGGFGYFLIGSGDDAGGSFTSDYNNIVLAQNAEAVGVQATVNGITSFFASVSQWADSSGQDKHTLTIDPGFADVNSSDFHLKSSGGRFLPGTGWVFDQPTNSSRMIDTGNPASPFTNEPPINGGRINIGLYGNTTEASRTPTNGWYIPITFADGGSGKGDIQLTWFAGWIATGHTVRLEYSPNSGATWTQIVEGIDAVPSAYTWDSVPYGRSALSRWRITSEVDPTIASTTGVDFVLRNGGSIPYFVNDSSILGDVYTTAPCDPSFTGLTSNEPACSVMTVLTNNLLEPEDVIFVDTGVYNLIEPIKVDSRDGGNSTGRVHIVGSTNFAAGGTVFDRVTGAGEAVLLLQAVGVELKYLTMRNAEHGLRVDGAIYIDIEGVRSYQNEQSGMLLENGALVTMVGSLINQSGSNGIANVDSDLTLRNSVVWDSKSAIKMEGSGVSVIRNSVLQASGNDARIFILDGGSSITNSDYNNLVRENGAIVAEQDIGLLGFEVYESTTDWKKSFGQDEHSLSHEPNFASELGGDFHLQSVIGRYVPTGQVVDLVHSPMIDTGDPASVFTNETSPNGSRINIGAYGNTAEGSLSRTNPWLLAVSLNDAGTVSGTNQLLWAAGNMLTTDTVAVQMSVNGGIEYVTLASNLPALLSTGYAWVVEGDLTTLAKWRVVSENYSNAVDASDTTFSIRTNSFTVYINDASTNGDIFTSAPGNVTNDGLSAATPLTDPLDALTRYPITAGDSIFIDTGYYVVTNTFVLNELQRGDSNLPIRVHGSTNRLFGGTVIDRAAPGKIVLSLRETEFIEISDLALVGGSIGMHILNSKNIEMSGIQVYSNQSDGFVMDSALGVTMNYCVSWGNDGRGISSIGGSTVKWSQGVLWSNRLGGAQMNGGALSISNSIIHVPGGNAPIYTLGFGQMKNDFNVLYKESGGFLATNSITLQTYRKLVDWQEDIDGDRHTVFADPLMDSDSVGEFHLLSEAGRYLSGSVVTDVVTSWAIDAGALGDTFSEEPSPNAGRVNVGWHGNTFRASRSWTNEPELLAVSLNDGGDVTGVQTLYWLARGFSPTSRVTLELSIDNGVSWRNIESDLIANSPGYEWNNTNPPSPLAYWRVVDQGNTNVSDAIDTNFFLRVGPVTYYVNDASTAGDVYTSAPGAPGNDGLFTNTPNTSLQYIIDTYNLDGGDRVLVDTGVYSLTNEVSIGVADRGLVDDPVVIIGSTNRIAGGTVFDLQGNDSSAFVLNQVANIRFEHIDVINADIAYEFQLSSRCSVVDSIVSDGGQAGVKLENSNDCRFERMTILRYAGVGVLNGGFRNAFDRCVVWSNVSHAVEVNSASLWISNSILRAEGGGVYCINLASNASIISDYNNFVITNGAEIALFQSVPAEGLPQWTAATTQDVHSISIAPLFADESSDDFHLMSGTARFDPSVGWTNDVDTSKLIDLGSPRSAFTNESAPNGDRVNMGVFGNTLEASQSDTNQSLFAITASSGGRLSGLFFLVWKGTSIDSDEVVSLDYSFDAGATWIEIVTNFPATLGEYLWNSTEMNGGSNKFPVSPLGKWRVVLESNTNIYDETDQTFFLNGPFSFYVNDGSLVDDVFTTGIGDDTNLGFFAHVPMANLRHLMDTYDMEGLDQVYVDTGNYLVPTNQIVLHTASDAGKPGSLIGVRGSTNGSGAVLDRATVGGPLAIYDGNASHVEIRGLKFKGGHLAVNANDVALSEIETTNGNVLIKGAEFTLNNMLLEDGILQIGSTNLVASDVTVRRGSISMSGNNLLLENSQVAAAGQAALAISDGANTEIRNNTLVSDRSALTLAGASSDVELRNNILIADGASGSEAFVIRRAGGFLDSDYNNLVARNGAWIGNANGNWERLYYWQRESGQDMNSLSHDPLFADEAGYDYHLLSSEGRYTAGGFVLDGSDSPLIDAGDPLSTYTNELAPNGMRVNIGAFGNTAEASKSRTNGWLVARTINDSGVLKGTNVVLQWNYGGMSTTNRVRLEYSSDAGGSWQTIASDIAVDASGFTWDTSSATSSLGALWRVMLEDDTNVVDEVDALFALRNTSLTFYVNNAYTLDDVFTLTNGSSMHDGLTPLTPMDSIQRVLTNYDVEAHDTIVVDTGVYTNDSDVLVIWSDGGDIEGQLLIQGSTNYSAGGTVIHRNNTGDGEGFDVRGSYVTLRDLAVSRANIGVRFDSNRFSSIERFMVFSNNSGVVLFKTVNVTNLNTRYWNNVKGGISIQDARTTVVENATFVGNKPYAYAVSNSVANILQNSIFYLSATNTVALAGDVANLNDAFIDYNVYYFAASNTSIDGFYRDLVTWQRDKAHDYRSNITNPLLNSAESGDFHLKSTGGRFEIGIGWVNDAENAWPIDKGNPYSPLTNEPALSGDRINIGAFGDTEFASKGTTSSFLYARSFNGPFTLSTNDNPMPLVWTSHRVPTGANVRVEYSGDNGLNWVTLTNVPALQEYMVWQLQPIYNSFDNGLWRVLVDGANPQNLGDTNDANIGMFFGEFEINNVFKAGGLGLNNLTFRGAWGELYLIQYTTNIVSTNMTWINAASGTGTIQKALFESTIGGDLPYEDPDSDSEPDKLYRVIRLPPED